MQVDKFVFLFDRLDCGCLEQTADSDRHALGEHQNPVRILRSRNSEDRGEAGQQLKVPKAWGRSYKKDSS